MEKHNITQGNEDQPIPWQAVRFGRAGEAIFRRIELHPGNTDCRQSEMGKTE